VHHGNQGTRTFTGMGRVSEIDTAGNIVS